ncbi:MAG: hypothetical protein KR126chlam2_00484 [Chlamydiae bacterium]|nr:hypothetical protein [Chlamydiota bacterium]
MSAVIHAKNPYETYGNGVRNAKRACLLTGVLTVGGVAVTTILSTIGSAYFPWALYGTIVVGGGVGSIALLTYYQQKTMIHHPRVLHRLLNKCGEDWKAGRALLRHLTKDEQLNFLQFLEHPEKLNNTSMKHVYRFYTIEKYIAQTADETVPPIDLGTLFNNLPSTQGDEEAATVMLNRLETVENVAKFFVYIMTAAQLAQECGQLLNRYMRLLKQVQPEAAKELDNRIASHFLHSIEQRGHSLVLWPRAGQ